MLDQPQVGTSVQQLLQDPKRRLKTELAWLEGSRKEQEAWLSCMKKIADKGGVVVVMVQGVLVTTYNYTGAGSH